MIAFEYMKKIKNEKPPIIEVKKKNEHGNTFTFEISDYCFVKNKYGYTVARYVRCPEQNLEYWDDCPSTHLLTQNDEWHLLVKKPIFSFHIALIKKNEFNEE